MTENEVIEKLKATQKESRFLHTLGVAKEAERLAPRFGVDPQKARLAGLLHDCAKNLDEKSGVDFKTLCEQYGVIPDIYAMKERALMHAFLGSGVAKKDYGVEDKEIIRAIYFHTTARAEMKPLEKLLYLADLTEEGRNLPFTQELRELLEEDTDKALMFAIKKSIEHVLGLGTLIHPDSIHALNYLIENRR